MEQEVIIVGKNKELADNLIQYEEQLKHLHNEKSTILIQLTEAEKAINEKDRILAERETSSTRQVNLEEENKNLQTTIHSLSEARKSTEDEITKLLDENRSLYQKLEKAETYIR